MIRHFLRDDDLSIAEQATLISAADKLKRNSLQAARFLDRSAIGLFFQKPSLRTRVSSEVACSKLGAQSIQLRGDELHFRRGETPADAARVLSGYLDLLMARVEKHEFLLEMAAANCLPIVNGLSDRFHPLQAIADLLTMYQEWDGKLKGKKLCYLGDGNNVCTSLLISGAMAGLNVIAVCPRNYSPDPQMLARAKEIARETGSLVDWTEDPTEGAGNADVFYTDVWISMGDEGEEEARREALSPYQLNKNCLKMGKEDSIVLHCLPAHVGDEISSTVMESPNSRILAQAHNRLPAAMAVFLFLLDSEKCRSLL